MATLIYAVLLMSFLGFIHLSIMAKKKKKSKLITAWIPGNRPPLPPGPKPLPFIGNLLDIQKSKPVFRWIESLMKELNTEIACIRLANTYVIPVTSPFLAREFLKKHDSIFSSRPLTMATEYATGGYLTAALVPNGDQWRKMKKVVATYFTSPRSLKWTLEKRTEEADNLVRFINNRCTRNNVNTVGSTHGSALIDLRLATRLYTGNVVRKMMFGVRHFQERSEDKVEPGFEEIEHVESLFSLLSTLYSFALSDYVPWLRPLDLDGHEKIVKEAVRTIRKYNDTFIDERLGQWRTGEITEPKDLLDFFILAKDDEGKVALSAEEIKAQVTEIMLATVDNPANAAEWAMAEMINEPTIMRRAVEEIDRVVGKDCFVQESDLPRLNYVKACAREALRLHPIAPFNLPHVSSTDVVVGGYFIPKGSHVLLSRIGLGRNPSVWNEPLRFEPERHLKKNEKDEYLPVELTEPELRFISFSTGRRGCIGVTLGSAMTVMLLARLIQGFKWSVPGDEGKIDLSENLHDTFMAKPLHATATSRLAPELYSE